MYPYADNLPYRVDPEDLMPAGAVPIYYCDMCRVYVNASAYDHDDGSVLCATCRIAATGCGGNPPPERVGTCHYCGASIFSGEPRTIDSEGAGRCKDHPENLDAVSDARTAMHAAYEAERNLRYQLRKAVAHRSEAQELFEQAYDDAVRAALPGPEGGD